MIDRAGDCLLGLNGSGLSLGSKRANDEGVLELELESMEEVG